MPATDLLKSNIPEFSVSELAFSLKKTLEDRYGRVRVRGELSKVMIAGSGHMYSSLKDDQAVIDAVCWKGVLGKLSVKPEAGMEVICTGRVSTYPGSSKYQLIIDSMELAGEGAILKMLEDRRKKLAAEGLFDPARKKPIPFLPETIGVVTSPTGAVIRDILHRLEDRFPRHVLVWPVLVQGAGAAEQIAAAIMGFQTIHEHGLPRPDVLIVARGGGSLEDLMALNEEIVVRAAAASDIPLISAVGHETDTTLIDYAADLRAPTPTGAAEMAVPVRSHLMAQVLDDEKRLFSGMTRMISEFRHRLEAQARGLGDPHKSLELKAQKLDHAAEKLVRHPQGLVDHAQKALERWSESLEAIPPRLLRDRQGHLDHAGKMLEAFSFKNVLRRGYVVVRDREGHVVTAAQQTQTGQSITLEFQGEKFVAATVTDGNS